MRNTKIEKCIDEWEKSTTFRAQNSRRWLHSIIDGKMTAGKKNAINWI